MEIKYIKIDELSTYPQNTKIHTGEQIDQIKQSIQEFGFNDPVAIWKDGTIIEGHGRFIAALELGYTEVPVIELNELSDEDRRAYALVHNQLTLNTGFDADVLLDELSEINQYDMEQYGFDLTDDFDVDSLFEEREDQDIKEVICPNCGFEFRVDKKGNVVE